jgi:hypothetical protein
MTTNNDATDISDQQLSCIKYISYLLPRDEDENLNCTRKYAAQIGTMKVDEKTTLEDIKTYIQQAFDDGATNEDEETTLRKALNANNNALDVKEIVKCDTILQTIE